MANKFFEELSRCLRKKEIESANYEDKRLEVFLHGQPCLLYTSYMCAYYKKIEKNIQKSTAESYRGMINGRIRRYFTARKDLTVGNITAKDIEDFYDWMFTSGVVANTVIHYHTCLLYTSQKTAHSRTRQWIC